MVQRTNRRLGVKTPDRRSMPEERQSTKARTLFQLFVDATAYLISDVRDATRPLEPDDIVIVEHDDVPFRVTI